MITLIRCCKVTAILLLASMVSGCLPNGCEKIQLKNIDGNSIVLGKIEAELKQQGYFPMKIYSIAQGKEVDRIEAGGKVEEMFASGKYRVYVALDNERRNGEIDICEPADELSSTAKHIYQSIGKAMQGMFGEASVEVRKSTTP